jgi:cation:H+ antiporter
MSVAVAVPLFLASLAATLLSSLFFARRLDRLSERLELSEGLHGILTALGADAPEISTAIAALVSSHSKIGIGVVVGSNVFNLAALLGVSALVAGHVRIHRHGLLLNGGVALAVTGLAAALVLGGIGAPAATLLILAILAPYIYVLSLRPGRVERVVPWRRVGRFLAVAVREEIQDLRTDEAERKASTADIAVFAVSLAIVVLGSVGMVQTASDLGDRWGVSDVVVGTLVLAALTSLPNLMTAVRLALHGRGAAVVSEALNSNSLNVFAGVALPGLVLALGATSALETFSVWWLVGMTTFAVGVTYAGHGLRRPAGASVIVLYVAFAVVLATR